VERAVLLCDGSVITRSHLPDAIGERVPIRVSSDSNSPGVGLQDDLMEKTLSEGRAQLIEAFERQYLGQLLGRTGGNVGETARRAGIDPRTLYNKMRAYDLRKETFRRSRGTLK
jgi:two-component system, NtrC family, response regulator AtoC